MFTTLRLDVRPDAVAVLTFDQPGSKANVLTSRMWTDLEAAVDECAARTDLKGLVLASAKPGIFIAGADLKLLADAPGPNDPAVRAFIEHGLRVLEKLEALPFPTCAAIDGAALGGGLEVAFACDYRVVGTNPKVALGLPEVTLGLIPGWGGTQRLPRLIGVPDTLAALHTGEPISLDDLGVMKAPSAELLDHAAAFIAEGNAIKQAERFAPVPAGAQAPADFYAAIRRGLAQMYATAVDARLAATDVVERGQALPLADAIKLETEAFMRLAGSPESKRLIAEFFASRKK